MPVKSFDLNIEEVLENWEVEHALREIIANALDEQIISNTEEIRIFKDGQQKWHIRDFGRGIKIIDFTLNENLEKINAPQGVIGKFGVGLKDALATFHRRKVGVIIKSPYGTFRLIQEHKHGFESIITLHIEYDDSPVPMVGTEFIFDGVFNHDMEKAQNLFLKFSNEKLIEENEYGQIYEKKEQYARVYILGVFASEEPNFLFSYNITSLTDTIKRKLNRERLNIGRSTYTDRVKAILKNTNNENVKSALVAQVKKRAMGDQCDELGWIEISQMALTLMDEKKSTVFFTEEQVKSLPDLLDHVKKDQLEVVIITNHQKEKLEKQATLGGPKVQILETYTQKYNESFQYEFIDPKDLCEHELRIYNLKLKIAHLVGVNENALPDVKISETIRITHDNTDGVWDPKEEVVIVKRKTLVSADYFASVLLHEIAHKESGCSDCTRDFESCLTEYLGKIASIALRENLNKL